MCGLIGIISGGQFDQCSPNNTNIKYTGSYYQTYTSEESMMTTLFYLSALRGQHSSGLFATHGADVSIFKKIMSPSDFVGLDQYEDFRNHFLSKDRVLIGHTRYATSGGMTYRAAHPHQHDNITLVHNGTLIGWKKLLPSHLPSISDSYALTAALAESKGDFISVLEKLEGAYAIIFHNADTGFIHVARNDDRTLSMASLGDTHVLASELAFAELAIKRHSYVDVKDVVLSSFKPGVLYTIKPGEETWDRQNFKIYKAPTQEFFPSKHHSGFVDKLHKEKAEWIKTIEKKLGYSLDTSTTVYFRPIQAELYTNHGKKGIARGTIYGVLQNDQGQDIETAGVLALGIDEPESYMDCDYIEGTFNIVSEVYNNSPIEKLLPEAPFKIQVASNSLKGFVVANQSQGVDLNHETNVIAIGAMHGD